MGRKWVIGSLSMVILIGLILGSSCAQAPAPAPSPAPAPAPAPATIKWKAQSALRLSSFQASHQFATFAEMAQERSQGRLEIEIFAPGAIVGTYEIFGATQENAVQVGMGVGGYNIKQVPEANIEQGVPGTFSSPDDFLYFMHYYKGGAAYKLVDEAYREQGAHLLKSTGAYEQTVFTKGPINTVSELQGLKIRASGANVDFVKAVGGSPVTMASNEVYLAMQTGIIDAICMPSYLIKTLKFWDVAKGMLLPSFGLAAGDIWLSLEAYDALPDDLKWVVEGAATEAAHIYNYRVKGMLDSVLQEAVKEHGVTITTLSDEEFDKMQKLSAPILDKHAQATPRSAELAKLTREFLEEFK